MKCVIPCAGESSRMAYVPKMLININNKPLLNHIIDYWKDKVDNFIFVIKPENNYYLEFFPENSAIVFQPEPKGLADAILRAEPYVDDKFIVALGDCLQRGTFKITEQLADLGIGVWKTHSVKETRKSYRVIVSNNLVKHVEEKPGVLLTPPFNCGMGTYRLDKRVFEYIRNRKVIAGGGDFTEVLQNMIDDGNAISPLWFTGEYVNVGSPEDIAEAERIVK